MALSQRFLFAILLMVSFAFVAFTYAFPGSWPFKFALAVIALAFDVLAFSTKFYSAFFEPFFRAKNKTVVLNESEAFLMAPSGNAVIVRKGSDVYASAFVKIPTLRSATEMNNEEKVDFSRLFSRALTLTKDPVKFGAQLYVINKDDYINHIRDKLNEAEEKYQNALVDKQISKTESERIKGEVTMWHNLYDNVSRGRSQALEAFAMITAQGGNEEEATNLALQKADELSTGISAIFGITASIATSDEMLRYMEPEYMIPLVTISEQIREKAVAGGT